MSIVALYEAFQEMNFNKINNIWNNEVKTKEDDPFIHGNINEIFHNIRMNYICSKIQAFKMCKLSTFEKVK